MEPKKKSARGVLIGGIIHPSATPQLKPLGPRKHLHVCKCFLWNSIMFLLVDSNPQCHRGNLCAIVDLCFTRPGGNHVFDPVHTSVYYSICHYWNMCSASQLRTSVFSLRFANGVFLKGSVKQAGKIMSRQKIDAQLFCWKCVFHFLLFCLVVWAHLSDYPDVYHLCHLLSHLCFIVSHLPTCPYIALLPCRHLSSRCLLLVAVFWKLGVSCLSCLLNISIRKI